MLQCSRIYGFRPVRLARGSWGPVLDTYELIIETDFAAAHRLREYDGNCERLHGHNWKVDVVVRAHKLDALGMVLDFREVKHRVAEITDEFDHRCLNDLAKFEKVNPTTENIAHAIYEALAAKLPEGVTVSKVTAWESDHCGASYSHG